MNHDAKDRVFSVLRENSQCALGIRTKILRFKLAGILNMLRVGTMNEKNIQMQIVADNHNRNAQGMYDNDFCNTTFKKILTDTRAIYKHDLLI